MDPALRWRANTQVRPYYTKGCAFITLFWKNNFGGYFDFIQNCSVFDIVNSDVKNSINTLSTSGFDGSTFISSNMNERLIKIRFMLKSYSSLAREKLLIALSSSGSLFIEDKVIDGFISSVEYSISAQNPNDFTVAILCNYPYFKSVSPSLKQMSFVTANFTFPHTFDGDFTLSKRAESAIENFHSLSPIPIFPIVTFKAISSVLNPSLMNINTYEKMKLNLTLFAGESIVIDSRIGRKSITRISGGTKSDCFNCINPDFTFFPLYSGDNFLKYDADSNSGGLVTTVSWDRLFNGI